MDKFLVQYQRVVVIIDRLLRLVNQGFVQPVRPTSIFGWFRHIWPIWYACIWLVIYTYLIFGHGKQAGLELVSQQIWCMMCVVQVTAKLTNGVLQVEKLQDLFKWCEECYTMDYQEYTDIVISVFEKTHSNVMTALRCGFKQEDIKTKAQNLSISLPLL